MKPKFLLCILINFGVLAGTMCPADDIFRKMFNGQPVGTAMSPDDANGYVSDTIHSWFAMKLPNTNPKLKPEDLITFANDFRRLGVTNLLAVYSQTGEDTLYRVDAEINPADDVKRATLEKALGMIATSSDIPAILATYAQRPLILSVLADHTEWDSDAHITDFLSAQLDQIRDAYKKSDAAPIKILELAVRNPSPAVHAKFDALLTDATQNPGGYENAHLFLDLLTVYIENANPTIGSHLPDLFTAIAHVAQPQVSEPYANITTDSVFYRLEFGLNANQPWSNMSQAARALFADPKSKDAIINLVETSQSESPFALVPAAACGSKSALVKLVDFMNGNSDPASIPAGSMIPMQMSYVRHYLKTIVTDRPDKDAVSEHINEAVYDPATCLWAIPNENGTMPKLPVIAPATAPVTPAPTLAPPVAVTLAPTPTPAAVTSSPSQPSTNPASSVPATPTKMVTATVIRTTTITATTPEGGHASVPLEVGDKVTVVKINGDGTVTARRTDYKFEGQVPKADLAIENP